MPTHKSTHHISRRGFIGTSAAAVGAATIVPRHVLGGAGGEAPSNIITYGVIGNGSRRDAGLRNKEEFRKIAVCDVDTDRMSKEAAGVRSYRDFRELLEQKDIDVVCIGTPPHWHAVPCIAAAQAGKDIFCEKPMTKFIAEGRAMADAVRRYGVVFRIGAKALGGSGGETRKIIKYGLMKNLEGYGAFAGAKNRIGKTSLPRQDDIPENLDYDFWLGPAPFKPYNRDRVHYNNRFYWDYEGGDLTNFGAHSMQPLVWDLGKDETAPVRVEPGPTPWPQHPDAVGPRSWVECTYADGLKIVVTGGKEPAKYDRPLKSVRLQDKQLGEQERQLFDRLPDLPRPIDFATAIRTRQWAHGHAEASHRATTVLHLCNIAIRVGRTIHFDPEKEVIVGDEEANRFVNIPLRAPWHI